MRNLSEKIRSFIEKLQKLPENKKKIILWAIVGILAVIMGFFWTKSAIDRIAEIKIPQLEKQIWLEK